MEFLKTIGITAKTVELDEETISDQQKQVILDKLDTWDRNFSDDQIREEAKKAYMFMIEIIKTRVPDDRAMQAQFFSRLKNIKT